MDAKILANSKRIQEEGLPRTCLFLHYAFSFCRYKLCRILMLIHIMHATLRFVNFLNYVVILAQHTQLTSPLVGIF